jgi:TPP-dependent pyruvate/acetoin dehydrogenase alpha subunit
VEVAIRQLVGQGYADVDEILAWQEEFADEVQRAVAQAQQESSPDPYEESWTALSTTFPSHL